MKRFAQVGASVRQTGRDFERTTRAAMWLLEHAPEMTDEVKHDTINLESGRDFLEESHKYDVVVLHSIFDTKDGFMRPPNLARMISAYDTKENWRKRLVETGASFIFIFDMLPCCLNAWNVGDLDGYRIAERNHDFGVFALARTASNGQRHAEGGDRAMARKKKSAVTSTKGGTDGTGAVTNLKGGKLPKGMGPTSKKKKIPGPAVKTPA